MRVGFFTDTYRPNQNGVVVSIDSFAAELRLLGCDVTIFAPRNPRAQGLASPLCGDPAPDRVHWVRSLPFLLEPSHRMALPIIRRLLKVARAEDLDLIHTQTPFQIGYAGVCIARTLGLPIVHTYHTYYAQYLHYLRAGARFGKPAVTYYSRWFCNLHDRVLAPSNDIENVLRLYGVKRPIDVLMTGIKVPPAPTTDERRHARSRLRLDPKRRFVLYVGRLAREKNLDLLLESVRTLADREPLVDVLLVGDGPDRRRLARLARHLGVADRVRLIGWVPHAELREWYAAADLFASPSVSETQGLALLEAMAHGLPVLAATGPGARDLVLAGKSGLLADPSPDLFAGAIHSILDDPELSAKLAGAARQVAESLDSKRQARKLINRYDATRADRARKARSGLRGLAKRAWDEAVAWRGAG